MDTLQKKQKKKESKSSRTKNLMNTNHLESNFSPSRRSIYFPVSFLSIFFLLCKLFFIISAAASSSIWVVSLCPGREGLVGGKVYNLARMFIDNLLAVQRKELFFWVATKLTQL